MSTSVLSGNTLLINDKLRREAESFVDAAADRSPVCLEVVLEDGEHVPVPEHLTGLFSHVLHGVANGSVSIQVLPQELTTTVASDMLGVSRPTLMKWVNSGELRAHKVGSHTRLRTDDVVEFRKLLEQKREEAFAALRAWDEAFDND